VTYPISWDVAPKDNDFGLIVLLKLPYDISQPVRGVLIPEVQSRVRIVECDIENAIVLRRLQPDIIWQLESLNGRENTASH
jgi:hypothetical protein